MIVKSPINALHNVKNPWQGDSKKVLCLCSAGLLRSPTVANVLHAKFGFNTRSAGTHEYALIPLSTALLIWADEVIVMDKYQAEEVEREAEKMNINIEEKPLIVLNIPDNYSYMEEELKEIILAQYEKIKDK